ncbi:transporter substrate-binding domain-containing protein [Nocardioides sp.]|uniref:transporter substrate-binding domain-containing protein n=1 Tax=Nocardioides sp. TaxID=35761 RepID=UPI00199D297F|nr:transporter substrate-binding domain-containing protein [Nocardioides sp.]MBC7279614.1 transporter substrate-binding domain-containing protein [Nocardioides sp.]
MSNELSDAIAPTGALRVVINLGNAVLAQGSADDPRGVTVDMAHEIGEWLGVPVRLTAVDQARKAYAEIASGRADLCFLANEPAREDAVAFTAPYVTIDGVYVVDPDSGLQEAGQVDRPGVAIGVREGSAYDLYLTRTLEHASIVRGDEATDLFESQGLDAAAGVRQPMEAYASATGRRLLEPPFMQINQAVGLPRSLEPRIVDAVASHVEDLKSSGFVAAGLARSGVDATVAPPA